MSISIFSFVVVFLLGLHTIRVERPSSSSFFFVCGLFEPSSDLLTPLIRERERSFSRQKKGKKEIKKIQKTIPIRKTSSFITFDTRRIYTSTLLSDDEETILWCKTRRFGNAKSEDDTVVREK